MQRHKTIGKKLFALSDYANDLLMFARDESQIRGNEDLAELLELLRRDLVNELSPLILFFQMYHPRLTIESEQEQEREVGS